MKRFGLVLFVCLLSYFLNGNKPISDFKTFEKQFLNLYENYAESNEIDNLFQETDVNLFTPDEKATYYFYFGIENQKKNAEKTLKILNEALKIKGISNKSKHLLYVAQSMTYLKAYWNTTKSYPLIEKTWQYYEKNPNEFTDFENLYIQSAYIYSLYSVEQNEKTVKISLQLLKTIDSFKEKKAYYLGYINTVILANVSIGDPLILFKTLDVLDQLPKIESKSYQQKLAVLYNNIGQTNIVLGNYNEALKYELESKKIANQIHQKEYVYEWYWHMAWLNGEIGNYDEATKYLKQAKTIIYRNLPPDSYDRFLINSVDFSIEIDNGKTARASAILDTLKSLNTKYKYLGYNKNYTLLSLTALYNFESKNYKKSKTLYKELINEILKINSNEYRTFLLEYYCFYIKSLLKLNETKLAKTEYQKALEIIKQNANAKNKNAFNILSLYSKIYGNIDIKKAKENYNFLLKTSTFNSIYQAIAHKELAKIYDTEYKKTKNVTDIEKSLQHIRLAYEESEKNFNKITSIIDKANFKSNSSEIIDLGLKIAFEYYKIKPKQAENYLVLFLNKPKFNILKENLEFKTSENSQTEFTILAENVKILKNRKETVEDELNKKSSDAFRIKMLQEELAITTEKLKKDESKLKKSSKKYYDLIYSSPKFSSVEIPKKSSLLSYYYSQEKLYVYLYQDNKYSFFTISFPNFYKKIVSLNSAIENNSDNALQLENEFYIKIFKPIETKVKYKSIIISPSEEMLTLNFEIFAKKKDKNKPNYLIENYNFSYWFSPDAQNYFIENNGNLHNNKMLVVSPVTFGNSNLANLSFSEKFAETITPYFKSTTLKNDLASETNFKKNFSYFQNVVLATHSVVDSINPANSFIAFNTQKDKTNDGKLHLNEITEANVNTNFLTLASCNSGSGKIMPGLGNFSFANSFVYAGVKSILFSNWKIDEKTTLKIITLFYNYLEKGYTKSEALRMAKLDFIKQAKDPKLRNPYYWGGLIIVGDDSPLFQKSNSYLLYFSLAIFFLALLGDFIFFRKNFK